MDFQILDPTTYPGWDNLLLRNQDHTVFHSSVWAKVLSESYRYKPVYFTCFKESEFSALIPFMDVQSFLTGHRGVSLPFTDYCEPLVSNNLNFQNMLKQIIDYGKKTGWRTLELRGGENLLNNGLPYATYLGHILNLSFNEDYCFSHFKDSIRRNIRKAIAEGVETKIFNSIESIGEFYKLNCLTRKRHGLPPQPYHFFKSVYNNIISKNHGLVILAYYKKKAIAGAVYFHLGERAIYKYGASNRKYQLLRPNNIVMWEAIKWYCQQGYRNLSFGRTETDNYGLRRFKSGWGAEEYPIYYYKYDLKTDTFRPTPKKGVKFYNKIFRKIPVPLLNTIGSLLYRHVG
jgi:hypothetical protein